MMRRLFGLSFFLMALLVATTAWADDCVQDDECADGMVCVEGVCVEPCEPDCTDKLCTDDDGCGTACGCADELLCCDDGSCAAECGGACEPDCADKLCTDDDGCGVACGCTDELLCCDDGACAAECGGACEPDCEGKICGDDGCGSSCGDCADGEFCIMNLCMAPPAGSCADSCGAQSGNGECFCDDLCIEYGDCCADICELCVGVVAQCVDLSQCGDDVCDEELGEDCGNCADCACPDGDVCAGGLCCTPTCDESWECGDDGCGGSCGDCGEGFACKDNVCVEFSGLAQCLGLDTPSAEGCDFVESYEGCCDDMGRVVWCDGGATYCIDCSQNPEGECGWQGDFYDCGTDGSPDPSGANPKECIMCDPACGPGFLCEGGVCVECQPQCDGLACGEDGCGGTCGQCDAGLICQAGACVDPSEICNGPTEPSGDDCGDLTDIGCCDESGRLYWCEGDQLFCWDCAGAGQPECGWQAEYEWYNCDTDGSADPTGSNPMICGDDCVPDCAGKECGADGCGGDCGPCEGDAVCEDSVCIGACQDECAAGDTGCEDGAPFVCEAGPDGCLLKTFSQCSADQTCENGQCIGGTPVADEDADTIGEEDTAGETPSKKKDDGGCSTGSGPAQPFAMFLLLLALVGLPVAARRRG